MPKAVALCRWLCAWQGATGTDAALWHNAWKSELDKDFRMSGEVLINLTPMETRVAVVENGVLQEALIERTRRRGIVGNIYKGRVVRVLPGMQAAFVDIGLERAAFIHATDIAEPSLENENGRAEVPDIRTLLREGQTFLVQVSKEDRKSVV